MPDISIWIISFPIKVFYKCVQTKKNFYHTYYVVMYNQISYTSQFLFSFVTVFLQ